MPGMMNSRLHRKVKNAGQQGQQHGVAEVFELREQIAQLGIIAVGHPQEIMGDADRQRAAHQNHGDAGE